MLPNDVGTKKSQEILTQNKSFERIIVSVSIDSLQVSNPDLLINYIELFKEKLLLQDKDSLISLIETQQDEEQFLTIAESIIDYLPLLLQKEDYTYLDSIIQSNYVAQKLKDNYNTLLHTDGIALKQLIAKDPLGMSLPIFKRLSKLKLEENSILYDGYISDTSLHRFTFFVYTKHVASNTGKNEKLESIFNQAKKELESDTTYKEVKCHFFGAQMVAAGNATQMKKDTIITLSITILLLLSLFLYQFRSYLAPLRIFIPVVFGAAFGVACMYLFYKEVSMIALGASSLILGIAINYSLHFLSHLKHTCNKYQTIIDLAQPMTIGGFTTVVAFLSLQLVHSPVLQQLGMFAAFNLIGSSLCTLIFLPHFISNTNVVKDHKANLIERISSYSFYKNKWLNIFIVAITILGAYKMNDVQFDKDLMQMNYLSDELKKSQSYINEYYSESLQSIFYSTEASSFNEALMENEKAKVLLDSLYNNKQLQKSISISDFLLSNQEKQNRINEWNKFWNSQKKQQVLHDLFLYGNKIGFQNTAFNNTTHLIQTEPSINSFVLDSVFQQFFNHLIVKTQDGYRLLSVIKATPQQRENLLNIKTYKKHYITDRQSFTSQLVEFVKDDFYSILGITSLLVFFTILITYGRIEIALLAFLPMVITWICILGIMALLGIQFNIINIIISTLIFGLGDDYSIFITDSLLDKYKFGTQKLQTVNTSIYLSVATAIIGLGTLIFASHPALKSIALVAVIGILTILFVSQIIQPMLFNFFIQKRADKKFHPFTLWSFSKTIFAFLYYVLGCMLVTILGFILTKCIPFAKDKMKYVYHVIVCKMMWSLLYIMGNVRKKIEHKHEADFSKPSVIIANHASFLDLLRIISLHPKILLMTNKWVWKSPVFGALVRMADYYPVAEGAEFSIHKLKYWVERGYHIAVFPEGTRSYDDTIKRFHKGAFYLAEKLELDIQPILFHGVGYTMSKGDFLLKDGEVNIKYLPRISVHDISYGDTYTLKAKLIGRYFRAEFEKYKLEKEKPFYFREQLLRNYIYKGPVLEWYAKIKTKLEGNYTGIESMVPYKGNVLDLGCGYGFLSYVLHFTSAHRKIVSVDYDEEKIAVANNNFSKNEQLTFIAQNITTYKSDTKFDCILIMDVLHYLTPVSQAMVLHNCKNMLADNGKIILRDGFEDMGKKHKGTVWTEIFSTQLFKFNKTENKLHFLNKKFIQQFADEHQMKVVIEDDTKFTSNIIVTLS